MKNIRLNNETPIDLQALLNTRMLVQANSGGGKSWAIRRLLEQSHGAVQQIVLDMEGEFGTLREQFDYVLAGKGGDTPADPRSAALLARKLLELGVSAIIDLYELQTHERKLFVKRFLEAMINAPKDLWHPCLVVIDEAHVFCPEKGQSEASGAVIDLCTRGRKRGYCAVLATQRISKLHKDAAAECNNKLIGRTGLDIDMKRASEELGFTSKQQMMTLRNLAPGEFYVFGPAFPVQEGETLPKVRVGDVSTTHPKAGDRLSKQVTPPTSTIKKVLSKLDDLPKEAEQEAVTISDFKNQIRTLKGEITLLKRKAPTTDPKAIEKIVEKTRSMMESAFDHERKNWHRQFKTIRAAIKLLERVTLTERIEVPESMMKTVSRITLPEKPRTHMGIDHGNGEDKTVFTVFNEVKPKQYEIVNESSVITGPEQRVLNAIAWFESIGVQEPAKPAVAFISGYSPTSSAFSNPCGALRRKGLIAYVPGKIILTDAGREVAQKPEVPPTQDELHQKVLSILPGPEQRVLRPLLEAYPDDMSKEEVAERSNYSVNSSAFSNPCGRLRTFSMIEYPSPGRIRATDILFP